jgi:light-regulated signal transduction histidine kinase (bacteriophytochrome)
MAHHFQEPARRLMVFARRLKQLSKLQANQDAKYSLDFIDSQAERLSSLVRDVQRYLAIDHNLSETRLKSTDASIERAIHQADVPVEEINWQVQQSLPQVAMGERQFQQLFAALISNAWRYRHPERQLVLVIKAQIAKERLVFTVMDNGLGIAPEYRQQVFELFERLVPSSAPGTGLGLAIARKLVRGTGGQMTIENGLEDGIAVVFDLPLAVQELKDTP